MRREGIDLKRAPRIGWRYGDPERDRDLSGRPIERNYVAFVYVRDCPIEVRDGRTIYRANGAPMIPISGHSRTNMAYGPWRVRDVRESLWPGLERGIQYFSVYATAAVYWVEGGHVWQGTVRRPIEGMEVDLQRELLGRLKRPYALNPAYGVGPA